MLGAVDNEPDIHSRLIKLFETVHSEIGTNEISPLHFKSVPADYSFAEKKPGKEIPSVEGILKFSWPLKHYDQIPSVVLFCVPFGVDWSSAEWTRRELAMQEKYSKLKATLATREVKLIVVMLKVGVGSLEKEMLDERISSFKRHAQTDSKTFLFFSLHELVSDNTSIRRLYKTIREGSFAYYASNIKRFKTLEKAVGDRFKGSLEQMLLARYSFKVAFLNEFQGQMNYSLRFYRQCYNHLAASLETIDEELYEQVKAVGEIAHFKTCRLLLLQKSIDEACQQFRNHILIFTKLYSKHPWRHSAWVAEQFLVFCQLLDRFSVSDALPFADRSYYYQNAARFTIDRARNYQRSHKDVSSQFDTSDEVQSLQTDAHGAAAAVAAVYSTVGRWRVKSYRGRLFCPPRFIGAMPQIVDPATGAPLAAGDEATSALFFDFLYAQEARTAHGKLVSELLVKALSSLPALSTAAGGGAMTTVGANPRRKALLLQQMATQAATQGDHEAALTQLWTAVGLLQRETWHQAAMPLLLAVAQEAIALGRARDYVDAALSLYANSAYVYFSRHDLEELHLHVACLLHHSLQPWLAEPADDAALPLAALPYVQSPTAFLTSTYAPLTRRASFAAAPASTALLPNGHALVLDRDCRMVEVETFFAAPTVELGETLRLHVTLKSLFLDALCFDELALVSFDDAVVRTYRHRDGADGAADDALDLRLQSFQPLQFTCSWQVTEAVFARFLAKDAVFGLDRVELRWRRRDPATQEERTLTLRVSACPADLHELRRQQQLSPAAQQTWSLRELYGFSRLQPLHQPPVCRVSRPAKLLELVQPVAAELLQGLVQRVDVVFRVGRHDLRGGKVFLSCDATAADAAQSVFYLPDLPALLARGPDAADAADTADEDVAFFPMKLNAAGQPQLPLLLEGTLPAQSLVHVPLFLRLGDAVSPGNYTLSLSLEVVPTDVMASAVALDFALPLTLHRPFAATHQLHCVSENVAQSPAAIASSARDAWRVHADTTLTLETVLTCLHTLSDPAAPGALRVAQIDRDGDAPAATLGAEAQASSALALRAQETLRRSLLLRPRVRTTQAEDVSLGDYVVRWRDTSCRPLQLPAELQALVLGDVGFFPSAHRFNWLLFAHPRPLAAVSLDDSAELAAAEPAALRDALDGAWRDVVCSDAAVRVLAETRLPLPLLRIAPRDFVVQVQRPATVRQGESFLMRVFVRRASQRGAARGVEKLRALVWLHEDFLIGGATSCVVDVVEDAPNAAADAAGQEVLTLRCAALRPGWLSLPRVQLLWERRGSAASAGAGTVEAVFDLGERDEARPRLFVLPAAQQTQ